MVKELKLNGSIISNSSELSNASNDHFSTIGPLFRQLNWKDLSTQFQMHLVPGYISSKFVI